MKKLILIFLFITGAVFAAASKNSQKEEIFTTPDEAINHFIDGLRKNDLAYSMEACSINEQAEKFSFRKYTVRLQAIVFWSFPAPSEYPFYTELNRVERKSIITRQIKFLCYSMLSSEKQFDVTIADPDEKRIDDFIKSSDPAALAGLKIMKIIIPVPDIMNSERNVKNFKAQAEVFGGDTRTERLLVYELEGHYYAGGISLMKYGNCWKIDGLYSTLGNTNALGTAKEVSIDELDDIEDGLF